jgi:hypothetical protein
MSKIFKALFLLLSFFLIEASPINADVSIGVSTWYSDWNVKPSWSAVEKRTPGLLYGPVLGVGITDKWSLGGVFLTGQVGEKYTNGSNRKLRRYDSDVSVNYTINRYFRIFTGWKNFQYIWNSDLSDVGLFQSADRTYKIYGPGIGIGLTLPVSDSFSIINNFSYIYAWGKMKTSETIDVTAKGYNITISPVYFYEPLNISVMIGWRYQSLKTDYKSTTDTDDTTAFYGFTLSFLYHFL